MGRRFRAVPRGIQGRGPLLATALGWLLATAPLASAQQGAATEPAPDPAYASVGALRLTTEILALPPDSAPICGVTDSFLRRTIGAAFGNSGIRLVTTGPAPAAPDPDRAVMPELSATFTAVFENGVCFVSYQFLLLAPAEATRIRVNRAPAETGLLLLWGHTGLTRKPVTEIAAEVEDAILTEIGKLAREFVRADAARSASPRQEAVAPQPGPLATGSRQACPDRWQNLSPAARTRVECTCTAAAVASGGAVWGTDVYTDDSAVCRAALHAGAVPGSGGPVTVLGEAGRPSYAGTARNGVSTSNYGTWTGSFRFERNAPAPTPAPIASGLQKPPPAPVQAPRGR